MIWQGEHCPYCEALTAENERLRQPQTDALKIARETLEFIAVFADVRSKDDSKTFARVNRGALRTIAEKANAALEQSK